VVCLSFVGIGLVNAAESAVAASDSEALNLEAFAKKIAESGAEEGISAIDLRVVQERENQTSSLPDPMISLSREDLPIKFGKMGESDPMQATIPETSPSWKLTLSQSLPWPGTLAAEARAGSERTTAANLAGKIQQAERKFAAKDLFLSMVRLDKTITVEKRLRDEAQSFQDFVHERYRQGIGDHSEFLQTHTESSMIDLNLKTMVENLENLKAHAYLLLGVDVAELNLAWPKNLETPAARAVRSEAPDGNLVRNLLVSTKERDLASNEANYRRNLPGFSVAGMLMAEDAGMRSGGGMIGVTIPLFSGKRRDSLRAERSMIQERTDRELAWFEKQKGLAIYQNQRTIIRLRANLVALDEDILPKVSEHLEASLAAFGQGKAKVSTVIASRRELLNLEITRIDTVSALAAANIRAEKIELGMIDGTLDQGIPGTVLGAMASPGMGAGDSSMSSVGGKPMKPGKAPAPGAKKNRLPTGSEDSNDDSNGIGGGSGMGM
jgi:outer membrane protein TolC